MMIVLSIVIILIALLALGYYYRKEIEKYLITSGLKQKIIKHKKGLAVFIAASSATAGFMGVPTFTLDIEDMLLESAEDYAKLGYDPSKVEDLILYEEQVLCEGHLPLGFTFKELSKDIDISSTSEKSNFISATQIDSTGFDGIDLTYKMLVREDFTYEEEVVEKESYTYKDENGTEFTGERNNVTGYNTIADYRYVWKEISSLSDIKLRDGESYIIDIVGNFPASTEEKSVDIIPTISFDGYSKTYTKYAWWNSAWLYRLLITVDHDKVNATLTNFPLPINITNTILGSYAQSDGDDIAFTNKDGNSKLNHEIEYYNTSNGKLIAWVCIPTLSSSTDTEIYMYFGNNVASNQENVEDVWDSDYAAVWHFSNTTGNFSDSTSNDNDITSFTGTVNKNVDGVLGSGVSTDGGASYMLFDSISFWNCTMFGWVKTTDSEGTILTNYNGGGSAEHYHFRVGSAMLNFGVDDGGSYEYAYGTTNVTDNQWHSLTGTCDNDLEMEAWTDGELEDTEPCNHGEEINPSRAQTSIGYDIYGSSTGLNGAIDELRISTSVRSDAWINAVHDSITDSEFVTFSDAQIDIKTNISQIECRGGTDVISYVNTSDYPTGFNIIYNSTDINYIRINVSDIDSTITSDMISLAFNSTNYSENPSIFYPSGDSGGYTIILDKNSWTEANGCTGDSPFPITTNTTISFATKIEIPIGASTGWHNNTAMTYDYGS